MTLWYRCPSSFTKRFLQHTCVFMLRGRGLGAGHRTPSSRSALCGCRGSAPLLPGGGRPRGRLVGCWRRAGFWGPVSCSQSRWCQGVVSRWSSQHLSQHQCSHWSPRMWSIQFSPVQFSRSVVSDALQPHESQHARPPCPSPTPGVHSDST